jgi:3-hydroxyacyl-CoA dehydrogenase / enoyl-CoA hydratase / 3-hydroxybutyryl-CoA epimerase
VIDYLVDNDGVAVISWNAPGGAANTLDATAVAKFAQLAGEAVRDERVRGVIVSSSKPDFVSGVDLSAFARTGDAESVKSLVRSLNSVLRTIETCGKPFVAAINGAALSEGCEICLACHFRVAVDDPGSRIGLPQVQMGLLPGA